MVKKAKAAVAVVDEEAPSTSEQEVTNVMYIGHLPHGFYEKQLKGFFSQFGEIRQLKVSRNKKTGKAKHYAFLEFRTPEVAQIASEAMDGYMLFTQKLDCHVLKKSDLHKDLFKGANRAFREIPWKKIEVKRHDGERTQEQQEQRMKRAVSRDQKRKQLIEKQGIAYEYIGLKAPKIKAADDPEPKSGVEISTVKQKPSKSAVEKAEKVAKKVRKLKA